MGVFFGIISSITTALHAIVIKKSMEVVKGNTMDLVYLNNVWSAMALLPVLFLAGEYGAVKTLILKESEDTFDSSLSPFWTFITGALITVRSLFRCFSNFFLFYFFFIYFLLPIHFSPCLI